MPARLSACDETVVSIVDGYVANALAGPNLEPFWAQGYGSTIRWVRRAHRLAGDGPPTIDRIAALVARPAELAQLVARAAPPPPGAVTDVDPERVELVRWHRHDWLGLDQRLRGGIAEGLRSAADTPVATRVRRVDGEAVPKGSVVDGVQPLQTETLYFGAWTGQGQRWEGWLIQPAAAAGLRLAQEATGIPPLPIAAVEPPQASATGPAQPPAPESLVHGYKGATRLVADLERKADLAGRAARAAAVECGRDRPARSRDLSSADGLASRLRDAQSALAAAAELAGEAAASLPAKSGS